MLALTMILLGYLSGSLPFSVWVGKLALRQDIRGQGDGNPGATNVLRAGGWRWGISAFLLDYLKGAIPVGIAWLGLGIDGWPLVLAAVAPVLGHATSPFLGFRGGKAVAVTFGIWTGLTLWEGPTILGLCLALSFAVLAVSGWAVVVAMLGLLAYFLVVPPGFNPVTPRPDLWPVLIGVWAGNFAILVWKHLADLRRAPALRSWLHRGAVSSP